MSLQKRMYTNKDDSYFSTANTGVQPLLPASVASVLEIGCGEGNTLVWLRKVVHVGWIGGVELNEKSAVIAAQQLDWFRQGDIETLELPFDKNSIDVVLCLDVLEHLVDPWAVVRRLTEVVSPGGCLIASVPNVLHHSVTLPLLIRGKWSYGEKDILDRTHLRFFTRDSALELLQVGGLRVDRVVRPKLAFRSKSWLLNCLTLGILRDFLVFQYLLRAVKEL